MGRSSADVSVTSQESKQEKEQAESEEEGDEPPEGHQAHNEPSLIHMTGLPPSWSTLQPPGTVQGQGEDKLHTEQRIEGFPVSGSSGSTHATPPFLLSEPSSRGAAAQQPPGSRPPSAQLLATARSSASRSGNLSAATSSLVTLMASVSGRSRPPSAGASPRPLSPAVAPQSPGVVPQGSRPTSAKGAGAPGLDIGATQGTLSQRSSANATPRNRVRPEPPLVPTANEHRESSSTVAWPSRPPTVGHHAEPQPLEADEVLRPASAHAGAPASGDVVRGGARSPATLPEHSSD
jgi:hypothetical protein